MGGKGKGRNARKRRTEEKDNDAPTPESSMLGKQMETILKEHDEVNKALHKGIDGMTNKMNQLMKSEETNHIEEQKQFKYLQDIEDQMNALEREKRAVITELKNVRNKKSVIKGTKSCVEESLEKKRNEVKSTALKQQKEKDDLKKQVFEEKQRALMKETAEK